MADVDDNILELAANRPRPGTWGRPGNAGKRYVRTPEGAKKYGLPMGALITADAEARAKARGRGYTVPEDDKRFGSQQPAAGRTRRSAQEIFSSLGSQTRPPQVTPKGPKKIAVGERGFSFPEGSRAFRSNTHDNFAIVRTPDYQLIVITEGGHAFELEGELEAEMNENLDDDQSPDFTADEPNPNLGAPGAPEGTDAPSADAPEVDAFRPATIEEMPGFLNEDRIQAILSGMEESGLEQNVRDAAELQLRRNNDRIRQEYEATAAPGGPEEGTQAPAAPAAPSAPAPEEEGGPRQPERTPAPVPEAQPEEPKPEKKPAAKAEPAPKQEAASSRPAPRNIDPERARRAANRGLAAYAGTPVNSESENSATDDEQLATLEELTRSRPTGVAEGEVNGKRVSVRRNRVNDAMEYSADDEPFQDRDSLLENTRKRVAPEEPRDTTDMEPSELSDQELDDVLADIDDALRAGLISRREARGRRNALAAERNSRTGDAPEEPAAPEEPETPDNGIEPGNETTREWAETAQPGAAAQTADGIIAERTEDGWETPLGKVQPDFLSETDVLDDQTIVVRNEPESDNRPVGATAQVTSPEEMEAVRPFDSIVYQDKDGNAITATRRRDGDFNLRFSDGLRLDAVDPEILLGSIEDGDVRLWHVPNQDMPEAPSRESWEPGNTLKSMTDLAAQKPGTTVRLRYRRSVQGRTESVYTVQGDGRLKGDNGSIYPASHIQPGVRGGRVSVAELPTREIPDSEIEAPRVVEDPNDYIDGDVISDYRHLRDMAPGQRVTLVVPAAENGGREAQVVLTRTRDEADLGGFMFLVGNGGRGYNSFGENNANLFQAIYDGRLHFGDIKRMPDAGPGRRVGGDWSRERNISLWEGGPDVSEYDLRTFIASQVAASAMQGSYYDTSLLPDDSPFRSRQLRDEFSARAIAQYSVEGNPARHKPAMIRLAAEKLGMQYTEPGSTLIPDNLTIEDFNTQVTLGRWLRSTGTSAEANMGPEQIKVTRADIKTALAVLDNMQVSDAQGDPDKILKRVFARQGSPLQDLNVAVAIASYFRMRRYKGDNTRPMTTIARQYDKRRNRELLRQMLREQLEGREPGYYGVPEDEVYERNGVTYTNRSGLGRPRIHAGNDENPNAVAPREESLDDIQSEIDAEAAEAAAEQAAPAPRVLDESNALNGRERAADRMIESNSFFDTLYPRHRASDAAYHSAGFGTTRNLNPNATPEEYARTRTGESWTEEQIAEARAAADASLRRAYAARQELRDIQAQIDAEADAAAAEQAGISNDRLDELDDFATSGEAYASAIENGDANDFIREVLGDSGVSAMDNGAISLRRQFYRAWNQRNGQQPDETGVATPEPPAVGAHMIHAEQLETIPEGHFISRRVGTGHNRAVYVRTATGWRNPTWRGSGDDDRSSERMAMGQDDFVYHGETNPAAGDRDGVFDGRSQVEPPTATIGQELGAAEINALPVGSVIQYTRVTDNRISIYTRTDSGWANASGGPVTPDQWERARYRVASVPGAATTPENEWAPGREFRGADIRTVPAGTRVRGASGTEWTVTETGIQRGSGNTHPFDAVESLNANFTVLGGRDQDPEPSAASVDPRVGTNISGRDIESFPDGMWFRSAGGTLWRRRGSAVVSEGGQVRRLTTVVGQRFRVVGDRNQARPNITASGRPAGPTPPTAAEQGYTRVSPEVISRYDQPHAVPTNAGFDTSNTTPLPSYLDSPEGAADLKATVAAALPEGSTVSFQRITGRSFIGSYTTPDGGSGSFTRTVRRNRIVNEVAHANGGHFEAVQDNLFAFYRQHGVQDVEVHGLSNTGNWNGAHTWIRRGFRPDPEQIGSNFAAFQRMLRMLETRNQRIEDGRDRAYAEFLDESKDLARRMRKLLADRAASRITRQEQLDRLYELWRELTYLGEVRDSNGRARRGQYPSLGWLIVASPNDGNGNLWYYGVSDLNRYFED